MNRISSTNRLRLVTPIDPIPAPVDTPHLDVIGQLRTLSGLRTDGVLTQEEYEAQRATFVRFFVNRSHRYIARTTKSR